jgi:hypothetical protein
MRVENHELDFNVSKDSLHVPEGEATQAVAVGNHNCGDMAAEYAFQKGFKPGALPVEA